MNAKLSSNFKAGFTSLPFHIVRFRGWAMFPSNLWASFTVMKLISTHSLESPLEWCPRDQNITTAHAFWCVSLKQCPNSRDSYFCSETLECNESTAENKKGVLRGW